VLFLCLRVAAEREREAGLGWAGRGRAGVDSYGAGSDGNAPPACSYLRACTVCLPPAALGRGDGAVAIIILPARRLKAHQLVKF
jgi:hypothetical protein